MIQIVKSSNEYYIKDNNKFFGSFHSIADAQGHIKTRGRDHSLILKKPLDDFKIIISCLE